MTDESEMFTRTVRVDRSMKPLQAFNGITSHRQCLDEAAVNGMPLGTDEEVTLHFFPIKKRLTSVQFASELEKRNLKPDPMAQTAFNQADPEFADKYPNGTQWQDQAGNFCYAFWRGWRGSRAVSVVESSDGWGGGWFACGVSK